MDLNSEQERYLHNVLDKGIESLTDEDASSVAETRDLPCAMQGTPTLPGFPASSSTSRLLYRDSTPMGNLSFAESHSLLNEVQSLQEKVTSMESLLRHHSPQRVPVSLQPQYRSTSRHSPSPTAQRLYQEIQKSEKEMARKYALNSPNRRSPSANSMEIGRLKAELIEERRKYAAVLRENTNLREKLTQKGDLQSKLAALHEDYNALSVSFDKSESIRKKQKDLIEQLKQETEDCTTDTLKPVVNTKKGAVRKTGKAGSKLIYAD